MSAPEFSQPVSEKGLRLRTAGLIICGAVIALSCHHAPTKPDVAVIDSPSTGAAATRVQPTAPAVPVATGSKTLVARPLTALGENSQARFSPDGSRMVFISRARPTHKQAQIYEMHLTLMTEKRVTFHDGDDDSPSYSSDGQRFLFASNTDTIKEEPYAAEQLMKTYYPAGLGKKDVVSAGSDLYEQTLNGRTIERLTRGAGVNTQPDIDPKGRRVIAFVSVRGGTETQPKIYLLSGRTQARLSIGSGADRSPRFAPDGKALVFTREADAAAPRAQLWLAQGDLAKPSALAASDAANDLDPTWTAIGDRVVFASNRGGSVYNLYSVDRAGTCVHRLTEADFDQREPAVSPDGKHILFTGHRDGHDEIYMTDYSEPTSCWTPVQTSPSSTPSSTPASTP